MPTIAPPNKTKIYRNKVVGYLVLPTKLDRTENIFERKYSPFNFLHKKARRFSSEADEPLTFQNDQEEPDAMVADIEDSLNLMRIGSSKRLDSNTRMKSPSSVSGSQ
jgi:hypothetical protein